MYKIIRNNAYHSISASILYLLKHLIVISETIDKFCLNQFSLFQENVDPYRDTHLHHISSFLLLILLFYAKKCSLIVINFLLSVRNRHLIWRVSKEAWRKFNKIIYYWGLTLYQQKIGLLVFYHTINIIFNRNIAVYPILSMLTQLWTFKLESI